jgi:hypothetical protein
MSIIPETSCATPRQPSDAGLFGHCQNSRKRGDVGLAAAIFWFARNGYTVCVPLTDSQDYDLIVDKDGHLAHVQARTTTHFGRGAYRVNLRVRGGNQSFHTTKHFDNTKVDLLFVLDGAGVQYVIPAREIVARNLLSLGSKSEPFRVS